MPPPTQFSKRRAVWLIATCVYALACLAIDLIPRHGRPGFRYTGSDPNFAVWNLGWPFAHFIYDPRSGLHIGPTAPPLIILQALAFAGVVAVSFLVGRVLRRREPKSIHWLWADHAR